MSRGPLELVFHGVRGTVPTTGAATRGYGGHTSCLEVVLARGHHLILDCGSGLRSVERGLDGAGAGMRFDVLLTHYHWDHLLGLPFFQPLYDPDNRFDFHGHAYEGRGVQVLLEQAIRPPWVPVGLGQTASDKRYRDVGPAPLEFGGVSVTHAALFHPQGVTAYRLERDGRSVVFATDTERGDPEADARLRSLSSGADVLIHDAQYTPAEYDRRYRGWGHSTWRHAVEVAREAEVGRLILFHHDPGRSDAELDALVEQSAEVFPRVEAAREGQTLTV